MAPYGKKTTSGRMLVYVIFFPRLAHIVNRGLEGGKSPPLCCLDGIVVGSQGVWVVQVSLLYGVWGRAPENFCFGTYVRLGRPTYGFVHDFRTCFWMWWFLVHGFGHDGFQSMVLDALACINMYYNIQRNIMKNHAGSPGWLFFLIIVVLNIYIWLAIVWSKAPTQWMRIEKLQELII